MRRSLLLITLFFLTASYAAAVDTTIKGGRMEVEDRGEKVFFRGGVKLVRGDDTITSSEMETNHARDKVKATGNVEFLRHVSPTEICRGYGKVGFYDTKTGEGYLIRGSTWAHMVYIETVSTTTKKMDVFADRFDFYRGDNRALGTGKVYGYSRDPNTNDFYEFWADAADYVGANKIIILTGTNKQPHVHQTSGGNKKIIHGDKITYYLDTRKFISEGDAKAFFMDEQAKGKK